MVNYKHIITGIFSIFLIALLTMQGVHCQYVIDSLSPSEKNAKITGHPILGYTPETSWAFGAAAIVYFRTLTNSKSGQKPSTINPFFFYTLNNQFVVVTKGTIYHRKSISSFRLKAGRMPDYYFGTGNFTDANNERYVRKTYGAELKYLYKLTPLVYAGIQLDAHNNLLGNFEENSALVAGNIPGIHDGIIMGFGPSIILENRDNIINPNEGWYLASDMLFYPGGLEGDYQFNSFLLDVRYYISSLNLKNTLALQFINEFKHGSNIPFYELSPLGGETRARGINANRYIDKKATYTQLEFRRKLPLNFGFVMFAGAGQVYPKFNMLQFSSFKYNVGFGLRMLALPEEKANFRLDIGFGPKGERHWYVGIQEVF